MTTPNETWDYDLGKRTRVLRKRQEIPSGHDPADYVTRRLHGTDRRRRDGADLAPASQGPRARTGPRPGWSTATAPTATRFPRRSAPAVSRWSTAASSTPSRMCAAAPRRAGAGTRPASSPHKPNTFADFIAATEHLVAQRFIAPGRAVAQGGSAGGMLIGAVANARPDLYAGMIAEVPFVDVLNTMLDDTLPLTPPEWPEWGNPITDARGVPHHPVLQPVRERARPGLSGDAGAGRADRSARDLLGAGQMGGAAARHQDRRIACWRSAPTSRPDTRAPPAGSSASRRSRSATRSRSRRRGARRRHADRGA